MSVGDKVTTVTPHYWGEVGCSFKNIGSGEIELTLWDPRQGRVNLALFADEAKLLQNLLNKWLPA